jgi:hypothetical protein
LFESIKPSLSSKYKVAKQYSGAASGRAAMLGAWKYRLILEFDNGNADSDLQRSSWGLPIRSG